MGAALRENQTLCCICLASECIYQYLRSIHSSTSKPADIQGLLSCQRSGVFHRGIYLHAKGYCFIFVQLRLLIRFNLKVFNHFSAALTHHSFL